MAGSYLIDSNAVIYYLSGKLPESGMKFMNQVINEVPNISVITQIEVLGYKTTPEASALLNNFVKDSVVIGLSNEIVEQTIEIRKNNKIKVPDSIIASSALAENMILISRNTKDFNKIKGLKVLNPFDL
jgi:predicted nucleic acid-binding protein